MCSYLTLIFLSIFINVIVFCQHFNEIKSLNEKHVNNKHIKINGDIFSKRGLVKYLRSLRHIIYFAYDFKYDVDMNFEFGLFLVNVNLKSILEEKRNELPLSVIKYLELILKKNDEVIDFFREMVNRDQNPEDRRNKILTSLFLNESQWISELRGFDIRILKQIRLKSDHELEELYSTRDNYENKVDDLDNGTPNPKLSDACLVSLAANTISYSKYTPKCEIPNVCRDMVVNGTDFGYALLHRLLLLLHAKFARRCYILNPVEDREMRRRICSTAYDEAQYIAMQGYRVNDLIMEQIALCGLDGHAKFLRSSWISNLLYFQSPYGCFGMKKYGSIQIHSDYQFFPDELIDKRTKTWKLDKHLQHDIIGRLCNGHVTAAAAATLSVAVRYILEYY
ncbi:uncharacterized protein LOC131853480 [Achroia grisella]|uniref:uncharacterized protein LOC131853480 n=1 Tax=Achroia grisella TaxID=688607 RepID=UPI0027D2FDCD|nr:uncharacterized protein LOC131853480 [Achroia grisella]